MKVYLLQFLEVHDTWTQGVYASRELTEQWLQNNPDWYDGYAGVSIVESDLIEEECE